MYFPLLRDIYVEESAQRRTLGIHLGYIIVYCSREKSFKPFKFRDNYVIGKERKLEFKTGLNYQVIVNSKLSRTLMSQL